MMRRDLVGTKCTSERDHVTPTLDESHDRRREERRRPDAWQHVSCFRERCQAKAAQHDARQDGRTVKEATDSSHERFQIMLLIDLHFDVDDAAISKKLQDVL